MDVSDVIMVNQFLNQAKRNSLTALYLELFKITMYLATDLSLQIYCRHSTDSTDNKDSTDSTDSTGSTDSTDSTDGTNSTDSTDSTDGTNSTDSTDSTDTVQKNKTKLKEEHLEYVRTLSSRKAE